MDAIHDAQAYKASPDHARPQAPAYARDLVGYGQRPPHPRWPGDARIAVQFVINYEEVDTLASPCHKFHQDENRVIEMSMHS